MEYEVTKETYDKIARYYGDGHFFNKFTNPEHETILRLLPEGSKILDAGCGPGRDVKFFSEYGYDVTGIDFSDGMLEEAKRRFPDGKFIKMDMKNLTFPKNHFDCIWACASLLHIKKQDAGAVLKGFYEVLKKGGILMVSVKLGDGEEMKEYPDHSKRFFSFWRQEELDSVVTGSGFSMMKSYLKKEEGSDIWIQIFAKKV